MQALEVVVDPHVLCVPNPCLSLEPLEKFVSNLIGWRGLLDNRDVRVLLSDATRCALEEDGEFPYRHTLGKLMRTLNCQVADIETVWRLLHAVLERTPSLEEHYGIKSILHDESKFKCEPPFLLERLKSSCRSAFVEDLTIIGVVSDDASTTDYSPTPILASSDWADGLESRVSVEGEIHDFQEIAASSLGNRDRPFSISHEILVAFDYQKALAAVDMWKLWDSASNTSSVIACFEKCITEIVQSGVDDQSRSEFRLGDGFLESLRQWGASSQRSVAMITIESCARLVLGVPKNAVNEFREGSASSASQLVRIDGARAFRTHLTKAGVALRLMFWVLNDGKIEFANIGGKNELEIA